MTNVINTPAGDQIMQGITLILTGGAGILVGYLISLIKKIFKK